MGTVWYQYELFWRRGDNDGDNTPQDRDDGTGDLLFNTLSKIFTDGDTSEWAINSFKKCAELLKDRQRWTDEFNKGDEAPDRISWWVNKYFSTGEYGYRSQNDMTRDPYITFGTCYTHLIKNADEKYHKELKEIFESVTIPWYVYRHNTFQWRRRFIKDEAKQYVKRLRYFKALAVVYWYEMFYDDDFYKDTP